MTNLYMFIRKLSLSTALLACFISNLSGAAVFYKSNKPASTLGCLSGQPGFAEKVIDHNPWRIRRNLSIGDAWSYFAMCAIKVRDPIEIYQDHRVRSATSWNKAIDHKISLASSLVTLAPLGEAALYINPWVAMHFSFKSNGIFNKALILGDKKTPFGLHAVLGEFPIYFGSGFTENPLVSLFQSKLGVVAARKALSINGKHQWNGANTTKVRGFAFLQDEKSVVDVAKGLNLQHDWKFSKGLSDNILTAGVSWVSALSADASHSTKPQGVNGYIHMNWRELKFKVEAVSGISQEGSIKETISSGFNQFKNNGRKGKAPQTRYNDKHSMNDMPNTLHIEIAGKVPAFRKEVPVMIGVMRAFNVKDISSDVQNSIFGCAKVELAENVTAVFGGQLDSSLKPSVAFQINCIL